jgi:ABC-type sugar transport system ATPase subunit
LENNIKLEFNRITKKYPGVVALKDVDLQLEQGKIHGLVGKNGAGKSTFVDIMYGWVKADSGQAWIYNNHQKKELDLKRFTPIEARNNGIYLVPQEPPFALDLSIEENFFLQKPLMKNFFKMDREKMQQKVRETLADFDLHFSPTIPVREISMEDRHLVYTALVVNLFDSEVVLLDEVTSALRKAKTSILFNYLRKIKDKKTIVLITHRIPEIFEICDTVSVFRNGEKIVTDDVSHLNENELANLIVGEKVEIPKFTHNSENIYKNEPLFRVKNLSKHKEYQNVDFDLYEGEILGITGLTDSGVSAMFRTICGINHPNSGEIEKKGTPLWELCPEKALEQGIVYCTNDRIHEGSFPHMSILENMNASIWRRLVDKFLINRKKENELYVQNKELFNIKSTSPGISIMTLSGGNQQKVILSRLVNTNPEILVLDEPTKGIDVGAKYEILKLLRGKIVGKNRGIIINSSSIEELIIVCDRIITFFQGEVRNVYYRAEFDERIIFKSIQGQEV